MSRDVPKKYPRTIESKNSYLRIRAPEHLDVVLEGLIRKVLREQPKMDDIYAFAADYFEMLLKIREKAGIRKLSVQDICPRHNEQDAHEMIKLASTLAKRPKESKQKPKTYQVLSVRDKNKQRLSGKQKQQEVNSQKEKSLTTILPRVVEEPKEEVETEPEQKDEAPDTTDETEPDYTIKVPNQEAGEVMIQAREVIPEENSEEEESPEAVLENAENVGDINEIRDKIREVETEIKQLDKKESQTEKEGENESEATGKGYDIETDKDKENVKEERDTTNEQIPNEKNNTQEETEQPEVSISEKEEIEEGKEGEKILDQNTVNDDSIKGTEKSAGDAGESQINTEEPKVDIQSTVAKEEEMQQMENVVEDTKSINEKAEDEVGEVNQTVEKAVEDVQEAVSAAEDVGEIKSITEAPVEEQNNLSAAEKTGETVAHKENETEDKENHASEEASNAIPNDKDDNQAKESEHNLLGENEETKLEEEKSTITVDNSAVKTEEAMQSEGAVGKEAKAEEPEQQEVITDSVEKENKEETPVTENNAEGTTANARDVEEEVQGETPDNKEHAEIKPSEDISAEVRSIDPTVEKEIELMGKDELKDEKAESGELIETERQAEAAENSESANEEKTEAGSEVEQAVKPDENDSIIISAESNTEDKQTEEKQKDDTEKKEEEKDKEASEIDLQNSVIVGSAVVGSALALGLKEVSEKDENSKNSEKSEEQTTSVEEKLLGIESTKPEAMCSDTVRKFLEHEREYSSHDKRAIAEDQSVAEIAENETKSETVTSSLVPRISIPTRSSSNEEEVLAPADEKKDENTDVEGDEDQQRDGSSTTSDEIEFETSPTKYPDDDQTITTAVQKENDSKTEPKIIVNKESEEEKKVSVEESSEEPKTVLLEVPAPVITEYPRRLGENEPDGSQRKKRSVDEGTAHEEPAEEVIIDCGNVGNEIIQRGHVQRVELVEGDEDILQVHLTTTIETEQYDGDTIHVEMTSRIEPEFEVSVETKVESPVPDSTDKLKMVRAAVIIQNGFRRFKNRRSAGEADNQPDNEHTSTLQVDSSNQNLEKASSSGNGSSSDHGIQIRNKDFKGRALTRRATRNLLETHSLDPIRKISPLKTRSLSTVRHGVVDFEIWNKLVQELDEAATKIQSNYRGYKTRKKLMRGNAVQSTTTTSEDSASALDTAPMSQIHTGEFHDSIVLPLSPE